MPGPTVTHMASEYILIDLSSIAYPIWHTSQAHPDANHTSQQIVARVRALANGHPCVAVCCDSGRPFRKDLAASYKANRPEHDASLQHQITLACEQLASDGFPIWSAKGFEADDIIASAVARFTAPAAPVGAEPLPTVVIVSADKDLLQLVGPRVQAMSVRDGSRLDAEAVTEKFGVRPDQVRDYLALVGDTADNIKGAKGIGPKTAASLLAKYGTLAGIHEALYTKGTTFTPAMATSLRAFFAVPWRKAGAVAPDDGTSPASLAQKLVTLCTDVEVPFDDITRERISKAAEAFAPEFDPEGELDADADVEVATPTDAEVKTPKEAQPSAAETAPQAPSVIAIREPEILPAPAQWERQLDPRSMRDARILAKDMHDSRMFSAYGTPQGVLSTIMVGRELGLPAMASLRQIHNIEGKHALSAQLMVALILKSGFAEYFDPVEFDETHAVYETLRKGARKPIVMTHTIAMAMTAGLVKPNSNWVKVPTDMLVARAQSRLARMVYPDIVGSLYTPEELEEARQAVA